MTQLMVTTGQDISANAIAFQQYYTSTASIYAILGQTSAWSGDYSDTNPPPNSTGTTSVNQQFCAIAATIYLMKYNSGGSGAYTFINLSSVSETFDVDASQSDYIANSGNLVMLYATCANNSILALQSTYRIQGFAVGVTGISGHVSDAFLPASNVASWGTLIALNNLEPQNPPTNGTTVIQALKQF